MKHIRIERDGTHTEEWAGRIISNARRGFYQHGQKRWPVTAENITINMVSESFERDMKAADGRVAWRMFK